MSRDSARTVWGEYVGFANVHEEVSVGLVGLSPNTKTPEVIGEGDCGDGSELIIFVDGGCVVENLGDKDLQDSKN
jgi:hypothetical protein